MTLFPVYDEEPYAQLRFLGIGLFNSLFTMNLFCPIGGRKPKDNKLPSMTEVVPQLSVEEIFRDYCRGVLHPARPGMYDPVESDDVEDVFEPEGIEDFDLTQKPVSAPAPKEPEIPEPAQAPEDPAPPAS